MGKLPAVWERNLISVVPVDERRSTFELAFPFTLTTAARIRVPDGYVATRTPESNFSGRGDFVEWGGDIEHSEHQIDVAYRYSRQSGIFDGSRYANYYREANEAMKIFSRTTELAEAGR